MRGVTVLVAAAAAWAIFVGVAPRGTRRSIRFDSKTAAAALGVGGLGFLVTAVLLDAPVPALAFALLVGIIPFHVASVRQRRAREADAGSWPDLLAHMRSSVAAGRTLPDAYIDAADRVGSPFDRTIDEVRRELLYGAGFAAAMQTVRKDAQDATADRVTMTLTVADESGGSRVGEVLAALSASVAGETRLRMAHEAALTEQRWTAGIALGAPWVILALSMATNPQAAKAYATAEGSIIVGIGLVTTVVGWVLSRRTAALSQTPRLFR
jgi:tight adherence protein B